MREIKKEKLHFIMRRSREKLEQFPFFCKRERTLVCVIWNNKKHLWMLLLIKEQGNYLLYILIIIIIIKRNLKKKILIG